MTKETGGSAISDEQRRAALEWIKIVEQEYIDIECFSVIAPVAETIRTLLQAPSVDREVVEALEKISDKTLTAEAMMAPAFALGEIQFIVNEALSKLRSVK